MASSEKIKVLVVDDIPETRENIRRLLQFDGGIEVVGAARNGHEAISLAEETQPDVVLMDINMPDMDGIVATETIRKKVTHSQIVILSVQAEGVYLRRAMNAGARDFLTKPPVIDELIAAINRAGKMAHEEKNRLAFTSTPIQKPASSAQAGPSNLQGKIVAVYSPKGGVGTTTIATNLAVCLANDGTKVAIVDGNLQFGDAAVFLNVQGKNTILDLTPRLEELDPDIIHEVMVSHPATGVDLLAAPARPELADKVSGEQFARVLDFLRSLYAYIIVDTSSYLTDIVLSTMDIADHVILLTTQDIPAIKSARAFLSLAEGIQLPRQRILFAINRYDKRISISPEKVGESLKHEVSAVIPLDERVVVSAVNRGIPFITDNKTQPIGRSLSALADLVREKVTNNEAVESDRAVIR